ncbi:MAG TPA: S-methyl-5-thioribose kinase, partial [Anaerolineales bacterium]|nr:S-methyl-5-thioribose kinase [Anaerolineales bacterium]
MPVDRAGLEYDVLQLETRWAPEHTVRVYWHDEARHLNAIEDLDQHIVLRAGLIAGREYPNLARHIGRFMAQTLFHTSDLYLPSAEKKHLVQRFTNPVMCKVQEDLVFTQPFTRHPNNRWNPRLDQQVAALHANAALISEVHSLKQAYLAHAQALLHNDLHSGSVLVNAVETRVIDPEFAFFGPIGHDVGSYLANLVLNYAGHEHHSALGATRARYRSWLLEQIRETWTTFEAEFLRLWETEGNAIEWPEPTYR